jgi:hypothetical protein
LAAENRLLLRHDLISQPFDANKFLHDQAARGYLEQKRFNFKEAQSVCKPERLAAVLFVRVRNSARVKKSPDGVRKRCGAQSEGTSCFSHSAARSFIRSNFRVAGLPFRTMVALSRFSSGKIIALATDSERNFIVP